VAPLLQPSTFIKTMWLAASNPDDWTTGTAHEPVEVRSTSSRSSRRSYWPTLQTS